MRLMHGLAALTRQKRQTPPDDQYRHD